MEAQNAAREEDNDSDEVSMHGTLKITNNSLIYILFILTLDVLSTGPFGVNHVA